jgi:hypothetical protein
MFLARLGEMSSCIKDSCTGSTAHSGGTVLGTWDRSGAVLSEMRSFQSCLFVQATLFGSPGPLRQPLALWRCGAGGSFALSLKSA